MKKIILLLSLIIVTISCSQDSNDSKQAAKTGQGGSMARFTISGNYLYTVDDNKLNVFSITDLTNPVMVNYINLGSRIETLFAFDKNLFIGSQNGMFIYSIEDPESPKYLSDAQHFTSCDPVISDGKYAYVTLHSVNNVCGNNINALEIYDVTELQNPKLIHRRNLVSPKGLGLYGNYLFICDDELKIFDVSNANNPTFIKSLPIAAFDVIIRHNQMIAIGQETLTQYKLNPDNIENITVLSKLNI